MVWWLAAIWTVQGWIPVEARFSASSRLAPKAHPASCTMGTGSFLGIKWPEHGIDHSPSSAGLWMGWSYASASPLCLSSHIIGWPLPFWNLKLLSGNTNSEMWLATLSVRSVPCLWDVLKHTCICYYIVLKWTDDSFMLSEVFLWPYNSFYVLIYTKRCSFMG
jgi:hypothetical protein